ncbi:MAG: MlaD family protein [Armatimonadota bacterium]|nr:MlaD family protein [Armatimonadota bacterium]
MSLEVKAALSGILIVVLLFLSIAFLRGKLDFRDRTYEIRVRVVNAGGMQRGAPVLMAGIKIGEVRWLDLTAHQQAEITLRIDEDRKIPRGSRFVIGTQGLLGDRFIAITPGPADAPPMEPGEIIAGEDPFTVEALFDRVVSVARRAEDLLANLNRLISDPGLAREVSETVRHARDATLVMRRAAENVEHITQTIERSTRVLDRTMAAEVPAIARQLHTMATELAAAAGDVRGLVGDLAAGGQTAQQIRSTVASIERAAQGIEKMVRDLQGVVNEQEVGALRASLAEARSAITEARQAVGEGRAVIGRADAVVQRVQRLIPERLDLPGLTAPVRLEYGLWYDGQRLGQDVTLTLQPEAARSFIFMLREAGGANRVGLQVGSRLDASWSVRYGLIDSHLGVGLDYRASPSMLYMMDLYNINQLTANVYLRYALTPDYGLTLRAVDLLRTTTLGVGLSRRF